MACRKIVTAWLTLNVAVVVLYTCVPPMFFNDGNGRIAGMPEILFWFTLLPFAIPAFMGFLYLYDQKQIREIQARTRNAKRQGEIT